MTNDRAPLPKRCRLECRVWQSATREWTKKKEQSIRTPPVSAGRRCIPGMKRFEHFWIGALCFSGSDQRTAHPEQQHAVVDASTFWYVHFVFSNNNEQLIARFFWFRSLLIDLIIVIVVAITNLFCHVTSGFNIALFDQKAHRTRKHRFGIQTFQFKKHFEVTLYRKYVTSGRKIRFRKPVVTHYRYKVTFAERSRFQTIKSYLFPVWRSKLISGRKLSFWRIFAGTDSIPVIQNSEHSGGPFQRSGNISAVIITKRFRYNVTSGYDVSLFNRKLRHKWKRRFRFRNSKIKKIGRYVIPETRHFQ